MTEIEDRPCIETEVFRDDAAAHCSATDFVNGLGALGVAIWTACPGGSEFVRPTGWQKLAQAGNYERLSGFRPGMAVCANTGDVLAVVDVDPRNGGDVENVQTLLADLKVRVFAEALRVRVS